MKQVEQVKKGSDWTVKSPAEVYECAAQSRTAAGCANKPLEIYSQTKVIFDIETGLKRSEIERERERQGEREKGNRTALEG